MCSRPKDPKTARNKNVLVIGGSGSGKTRFWLKPNLMQCTSETYGCCVKDTYMLIGSASLARQPYPCELLRATL